MSDNRQSPVTFQQAILTLYAHILDTYIHTRMTSLDLIQYPAVNYREMNNIIRT